MVCGKLLEYSGNKPSADKHKALHQLYKRDEFNDTKSVAKARKLNSEWDKEAAMYRVYEIK